MSAALKTSRGKIPGSRFIALGNPRPEARFIGLAKMLANPRGRKRYMPNPCGG